jgi:hypothetical protein
MSGDYDDVVKRIRYLYIHLINQGKSRDCATVVQRSTKRSFEEGEPAVATKKHRIQEKISVRL